MAEIIFTEQLEKKPVSYRAGAYRCNNDTFKALFDAGFKIDSSMYYAKAGGNNNISNVEYTNQVFKHNGIIEFPIEAVYTKNGWRKLDLDSLSLSEIIDVIEQAKKDDNYNAIQIMFHSYSFIDLSGEKCLIKDGNKTIYGVNEKNKKKIEALLEYINNDEELDVITFEDYLKLKLDIPMIIKNNFFYLVDKDLAFMNMDIKIRTLDDNTIEMENTFKKDKNCDYNFSVTDKNKTYCSSGWMKDNKYSLQVPVDVDGIYYLKCYMRDDKGNRYSSVTHDINVEDGKIKTIRYH